MTATTWVRIPGFPDYEVSNDGQVRSWKTWRGAPGPRILKPVRVRDDRPSVVLYGDGRHARREVHRLVMLAFVGPRPAGMDIRHLDGDVQNNSIGNLAYGTRSENLLDAVRHG